jgi:hypothetical protein
LAQGVHRQPLFQQEVPLRAALRIAFVLVLPALTLGGCSGTATTDDCHISVDCSVMPFPSSGQRTPSARAVLSGPALPPDPAAGAHASEACPAALRPATVFPPASTAQRYTGPIIVGFDGPVPADYALWAGDLSNAKAQEALLTPVAPPYPPGWHPYPFDGTAAYYSAGPFTINAGDDVLLYAVTPVEDNCAPALAGGLGRSAGVQQAVLQASFRAS